MLFIIVLLFLSIYGSSLITKLIKGNIEFIKYVIVGAINTCVSLLTIVICMLFIKLEYDISNIIGYIIGLINSFIWNKNWVFKRNKSKQLLKELGFFFLVFIICFGIQFLSLTIMVEKLKLNEYLSQLFAAIIYTVPSYFFNCFITFKSQNNYD